MSKELIIDFCCVKQCLNYSIQLLVKGHMVETGDDLVERNQDDQQATAYCCEEELTGKSQELQLGKFKQGIMNAFFSTGMLENSSSALRLHRGFVDSSLMEAFRI